MTEPLTVEERLEALERIQNRRWLTGPLIWLVAGLVGLGVLWIAVDRAQQESADAINHSVCGFRKLAEPTLLSYQNAAKDPSLSASARARNAARIEATETFLATQVTVPRGFNCAHLEP